MVVTLIQNSNGTKELQYGEQHLSQSNGIDYYTYKDISEEQLNRIRNAATTDVQKILSELF